MGTKRKEDGIGLSDNSTHSIDDEYVKSNFGKKDRTNDFIKDSRYVLNLGIREHMMEMKQQIQDGYMPSTREHNFQ